MPRWSYETRVARPAELASDPCALARNFATGRLHRQLTTDGNSERIDLSYSTLPQRSYHTTRGPAYDRARASTGVEGDGMTRGARRGGGEGMEEVERDREGDGSDGRGGESGWGAGAAGAERRRGRQRGGGGAPRPPCALASPKKGPARASTQKRVGAAGAAAKSAGATADAALSGPPPGRSAGGDGRARGPGFGPGPGAHLVEGQKIDRLVEAAPATRRGGWGRGV